MDPGGEQYRLFLAGDDGAMAEIIRLYQKSLLLYLNTLVGNIHTAEDLTEDTFVKLVTKKPKFRGDASFKTWLFAIGRRTALDHLRRQRQKPPLSIHDYGDLLASDDDPTYSYEQQERIATLRRVMYTLPPAYRQVLWLVYFEDCSHKKAATVMGKSVHSIDTLIYRARQALKIRLEQEGISSEDL